MRLGSRYTTTNTFSHRRSRPVIQSTLVIEYSDALMNSSIGMLTAGKATPRGISLKRKDRPLAASRSPSLRIRKRPPQRPHRIAQIRCGVSANPVASPATEDGSSGSVVPRFSVAATKQLTKATRALRSYGWFGFWCQLALGITSGVVLIFSIAFTAQVGPRAALYLTALGVSASFISCFQYFGMVRTSRQMRAYLEAPPGAKVKKISKEMVLNSISQCLATSIAGLSCTCVAMQSLVGLLLAKTLTNATANPFVAGSQTSWNPVLAIDVFLLQSSTNTILSHTIGTMICLWLLIKLRDRTLWEALFGISKEE